MTENEAIILMINKSLDRAFVMGQNYWADADSESYSANKRSDVTRQKFKDMQAEICDIISKHLNQTRS